MSRSTAKLPIAPGIYRQGHVLKAEVRIGSARDGSQRRAYESFPLGTPLDTIRSWQHDAKSDLLDARGAPAASGSLAADIPVYLATLPDGEYKTESAYLLAHWRVSPLGAMARAAIKRLDVVAQVTRWIDAGVAPASVNKRLSRLRKLYAALDTIDVPAPTDKVKFLPEPEPERRDVPVHIVRLILDSLTDQGRAERGHDRPTIGITKIRLRVMAWTGIAPATLARIQPRDLDLKGGRLHLRARRKGKGAAARWVSLLPPAVDALRDFAAANLFGRAYSNSSIGKTWRVGIARATHAAAAHAADTGDRSWIDALDALPPGCKPYDLRHSFGSEMYRRTGDIRAVSELLQHATLEMTKRYTQGAVSERVSDAITKAATTYASVATLPAPQRLRLVSGKDR